MQLQFLSSHDIYAIVSSYLHCGHEEKRLNSSDFMKKSINISFAQILRGFLNSLMWLEQTSTASPSNSNFHFPSLHSASHIHLFSEQWCSMHQTLDQASMLYYLGTLLWRHTTVPSLEQTLGGISLGTCTLRGLQSRSNDSHCSLPLGWSMWCYGRGRLARGGSSSQHMWVEHYKFSAYVSGSPHLKRDQK